MPRKSKFHIKTETKNKLFKVKDSFRVFLELAFTSNVSFIRIFKVAGPMGFTIARPMEFELNERRTTGFFDAIKQAKRSKPNLQMVKLTYL